MPKTRRFLWQVWWKECIRCSASMGHQTKQKICLHSAPQPSPEIKGKASVRLTRQVGDYRRMMGRLCPSWGRDRPRDSCCQRSKILILLQLASLTTIIEGQNQYRRIKASDQECYATLSPINNTKQDRDSPWLRVKAQTTFIKTESHLTWNRMRSLRSKILDCSDRNLKFKCKSPTVRCLRVCMRPLYHSSSRESSSRTTSSSDQERVEASWTWSSSRSNCSNLIKKVESKPRHLTSR